MQLSRRFQYASVCFNVFIFLYEKNEASTSACPQEQLKCEVLQRVASAFELATRFLDRTHTHIRISPCCHFAYEYYFSSHLLLMSYMCLLPINRKHYAEWWKTFRQYTKLYIGHSRRQSVNARARSKGRSIRCFPSPNISVGIQTHTWSADR